MRVVFYSNFLNHHQLPLCLEFVKRNNIQFTFVATEKIPKERLDMKYVDMNESYPFVLRSYESQSAKNLALELAKDADIVIIGSAPEYYIENRLKIYNKITYRFCERSLRKGTWRRFIPRTRRKIINDYIQFVDKKLYILGASAYTANDLVVCGFPVEKCYKWGYFPHVEQTLNFKEILNQKKKNSIIWVGRFISWKHPEAALKIAKQLKMSGVDFSMKMIGDGPLKDHAEKFVKRNHLEDLVVFTGSITNEEVRKSMLQSEVFLFTSDFYEGWGAVCNEAMSSMCVPVISHACGAAAFLIKPKENGFIYRYGSEFEAVKYIQQLLANKNMTIQMSYAAYETMVKEWNAAVAVERLLELSKHLIKKENADLFLSGPCSKASLYKNNWYKEK